MRLGIVYGFQKSRWIGHHTDELMEIITHELGPRGVIPIKLGLMDLKLSTKGGRLRIHDIASGKLVKNLVDAIYIANWRINPEVAMALVTYAHRHNIPVLNAEIGGYIAMTKLGEFAKMSDQDLPLPDSVFVRHKHLLRMIRRQKLPFAFPFIAKTINGTFGANNWLINSYEQLIEAIDATPESMLVLQQFIANDGDYRVTVFGGKVRMGIWRTRTSDATHVNNTSQGGRGDYIAAEEIPEKIRAIALRAAQAAGRADIGGVDIVVDSTTDRPYVLEVNKSPQLETGTNVSYKLAHFGDYIEELMKASR